MTPVKNLNLLLSSLFKLETAHNNSVVKCVGIFVIDRFTSLTDCFIMYLVENYSRFKLGEKNKINFTDTLFMIKL